MAENHARHQKAAALRLTKVRENTEQAKAIREPALPTSKKHILNCTVRDIWEKICSTRKPGSYATEKNGGFVEPFAPNEVTFGFTGAMRGSIRSLFLRT